MTGPVKAFSAFALLSCSCGTAWAAAACEAIAPTHSLHPRSQIASDDVGLAVAKARLSMWPKAGVKLNPEAGIELLYVDGTKCFSTFDTAGADGITLRILYSVTAVSAAVCRNDQGECIPIFIDLRRTAKRGK